MTFGYVIGLATVNIHRSNKAVLLLGNRFTAEPLRIGFSILTLYAPVRTTMSDWLIDASARVRLI